MKDITETFGKLYHPVGALLIYKAGKYDAQVYVEAYDIGINGNPVNAHPLSVKESNALAKALDVSQELGRSFLRPRGLMPTNILHINPDGNSYAMWRTPAMRVNLFFREDLTIESGSYPVPALIWKAGKENLSIFAVKDKDETTLETPLYNAPFFNIHGDGRVCMGDVKIAFKEGTRLEDFIAGWQHYFFNSIFSHLIGSSSPVQGNIMQLYQSLTGTKRKFPQSALVKSRYALKNLMK